MRVLASLIRSVPLFIDAPLWFDGMVMRMLQVRGRRDASSSADVQRLRVGVELGRRAERDRPLVVDMSERCAGDRGHPCEIGRFAKYVVQLTERSIGRVAAFG